MPIIGDVAEISDGRVRLRAGTLYAALDRLRTDELVIADREEVVDGRLRRYYRLTETGTARLTAETARMRHNAEAAAFRLGLAFTGLTPPRPRRISDSAATHLAYECARLLHNARIAAARLGLA